MKFMPLLSLALLALAGCSQAPADPEVSSDNEANAGETESSSDTGDQKPSDNLLMPLPSSTVADITAADLAVRIKTLADDTFEGRGPGAENGEKAADWIAAEMARIGLKPGGDNGSWFQNVGMVEQTLDESQSKQSAASAKSGPAWL